MDVVQVSRVQEIFGSVLAVEEESLSKEISVAEMLELVSTVNTVLQVLLLCGFCLYCIIIIIIRHAPSVRSSACCQ